VCSSDLGEKRGNVVSTRIVSCISSARSKNTN
jgi:hypothetical protein